MGPLDGIKVIELAAIGPVPFCAMLLGDLGADVIRVDRVSGPTPDGLVSRGRRSIAIDLKQDAGVEVVLGIVETADVLLEGFRPGVMERLGLGPEDCHARNPSLVYGRMTGWGRDGPLAASAGHDINYIGLAGALHGIGGTDRPQPPLNLIGDYGGGAMYLALGVLAALVERMDTGVGQVVDSAMIDGAASLMTPIYELHARGLWSDERQNNLLDGAAPFYRTYRTADDRFVAVGALEPKFYEVLLRGLGLDPADLPDQLDRASWSDVAERFESIFAERSRDHWENVFAGTDACVTPVLTLAEAPHHPHARAREAFRDTGSGFEPAPAPRFSRSSMSERQE